MIAELVSQEDKESVVMDRTNAGLDSFVNQRSSSANVMFSSTQQYPQEPEVLQLGKSLEPSR